MLWANKFKSLDEKSSDNSPDEGHIIVVPLFTKVRNWSFINQLHVIITEWVNHGQDKNQLPLLNIIDISFNVNFVDVKIESKQVNTMEEETCLHVDSGVTVPFEVEEFVD